MANQMWRSSITGKHRQGTRLAELRLAIGLGTRAIMEPLVSCPANQAADAARTDLERWGFDAAGVAASEGGAVLGYVLRQDLNAGAVRDHLKVILAECLIAESAPLGVVLSTLKTRERLFVLVDAEVAGIVTMADLNKPPARVHFFGLVSLLELHLTYWIRREYLGDSWQGSLEPGRLMKVKRFFGGLRRRGVERELFECLQFCDKRALILDKNSLRRLFEIEDAEEAVGFFERAENLRNNLAHSHSDLAADMTWVQTIEVAERIARYIELSEARLDELPLKERGYI